MLEQMRFNEESNEWIGMLTGELDAVQAPKLVAAAAELFAQQKGSLYFDCKQLEFVDSMGLGALVKLRKMVGEAGGTITMVNMKQRIYKLFVITGLQNTFGIEVEA